MKVIVNHAVVEQYSGCAIRNMKLPNYYYYKKYAFFFFLLLRIPHTTNFEPLLDMLGVLGVDSKEKIHVAN